MRGTTTVRRAGWPASAIERGREEAHGGRRVRQRGSRRVTGTTFRRGEGRGGEEAGRQRRDPPTSRGRRGAVEDGGGRGGDEEDDGDGDRRGAPGSDMMATTAGQRRVFAPISIQIEGTTIEWGGGGASGEGLGFRVSWGGMCRPGVGVGRPGRPPVWAEAQLAWGVSFYFCFISPPHLFCLFLFI